MGLNQLCNLKELLWTFFRCSENLFIYYQDSVSGSLTNSFLSSFICSLKGTTTRDLDGKKEENVVFTEEKRKA
jgi:hypothetical protein